MHACGARSQEPTDKLFEARLTSFVYLYDACETHLLPGTASPERRAGLDRLHTFRNGWAHFGRFSWPCPVQAARDAILVSIEVLTVLLTPDGLDLGSLDLGSLDSTVRYWTTLDTLLQQLRAAELWDRTKAAAISADHGVAD